MPDFHSRGMKEDIAGNTVTRITQVSGRRHHITIVSETFPPEINGVANTLKYLCLGLMRRGHRVTIIRPRQCHESKGEFSEAGDCLFSQEHIVTGLPLPGYGELRFGIPRPGSLASLWKRQRPDAIYVATQGPLGGAAVSAARKAGIPISSGFHTNFHAYSRYYGAGFLEKMLCAYGRWFHNRTALTLVPTRTIARTTADMGIHPTSVWSRGVDCSRFAPHKRDQALRQQWGLQPNDRAVLYVGRLAPEKNLRMAVACFERIRGLHPNARFILVGDGPMRKRLADQPTLMNRIRAQARLDALELDWAAQIDQFEHLILNQP